MNPKIDVESDKWVHLNHLFEMLDDDITHWRADSKTLIFYWNGDDGNHPFPCKMTTAFLSDMARGWLSASDYGPHGNGDGSFVRGFRFSTINLAEYMTCTIEPAWIYYSK